MALIGIGAHTARHSRRIARQRRELALRLPAGIQQMALVLNSKWFLVAWGLSFVAGGAAIAFVGVVSLVRR
jgi:hypothetical protein